MTILDAGPARPDPLAPYADLVPDAGALGVAGEEGPLVPHGAGSAAVAMTLPAMRAFVALAPDTLVPNPRNPRVEVGSVEDLKTSFLLVGILQPLVVRVLTDPEGHDYHEVVIGHRRRQAAIELNLPAVPCLVASDDDAAAVLVSMLAENTNRVGFTVTEIADAYQQLTLLDWTPQQIADMHARPVEQVRQSLTLTGLPPQVRQAADAGSLDLEHAAQIEEFRDDPKALATILKAGGQWGFRHAIAEARQRRDRKTAVERLKAELLLAGVKVISKPKDWPWGVTREVLASQLLDKHGNPVDPQQVRTKPGFAAIVQANGVSGAQAVIVSTDPEAWGYQRPASDHFITDAKRSEQAAADAAIQAHRDALAVAAQVRHVFLREYYGTAKTAKKVFIQAIRDTVRDPGVLRYTDTDTVAGLADAIAGATILPHVETAAIDRLTRMIVARWVASAEQNLHLVAAGQRYSVDPVAALAYLDRLTDAGYTLSPAEQTVADNLRHNAGTTDDHNPDGNDDVDDERQNEVNHDEDEDGHVDRDGEDDIEDDDAVTGHATPSDAVDVA